MSSLRNFAIAFLIALLAFTGVAYYSMGVVSTLFDPEETIDDSGPKREAAHFDSNIGDDINTALKSGRSFTALIVGTDYDPQVYDYTPDTSGHLVVDKKVEATTIYLVRFDKEHRAMQLCLIPSSTLVTIDYVEMTLGKAYAFGGAEYVRDQVGGITGLAVDFLFEFSGRQFVANGPQTPYTVPLSMSIPTYKGVSGGNYDKGEQISGNALYRYLHYTGFKTAQFPDRVQIVNDIFLQTLVKFAAADSAAAYYQRIAPFSSDMTLDDVSELLEVLTVLPLFVDSNENRTTVNSLDLYKCGSFLEAGFRVDRAAAEALFAPYKNNN